ncbi:MAG: hypothetical protein JNL82_03950 [Myxococcales bacterium]|nr:hypothetical protein [Myxococcales bacterium]
MPVPASKASSRPARATPPVPARPRAHRPVLKASPTQPVPKASPTQPVPKASHTQPVPKASHTQPVPKASHTQPVPKAIPVPPVPKARPARPAPKASPTRPVPKASHFLPHLRTSLVLLAPLLLVLAACAPPDPPGPAAAAAARELWRTRCANCHGPHGRGDGPSGRALFPAPRDFHDPTWQAGVTDDHLRRIIVEGGHSVGLSRDMAANADLAGRPAVVGELVQIVRGFGQPPPPPSPPPPER